LPPECPASQYRAAARLLHAWLARSSQEPAELRDPGLLQLFFADLGPPGARLAIATSQLAIHRAKLADYEEDARVEGEVDGALPGNRTAERWRGETLRMGILYERAAVEFWTGIAAGAERARGDGADGVAVPARATADGALVRW
jgi:PadR family transcriptional regulator, regulatory protein AphA